MNHGGWSARQGSWDARAAANFICGGAGAGLLVFAALSGADGDTLTLLVLAGLALVAIGLLCVWHELGRPLRAPHVFFHPRTSWMSREAIAAVLLFPAGLLAAARVPGFAWLAAFAALAFVVCQGRMLQAARGIPAWRQPLVTPLLVLTGLVEGGGLFLLASAALGVGSAALLALFGALALLRLLVWLAYRRALAAAAPRAALALAGAGRALQVAGGVVPLALVAIVASGVIGGMAALAAAALAGLCAAASGGYLKYALIMRAGFTQGFALAHLPVRRRSGDPPTLAARAE